jgi:hypothetical protein
MNYRRWINYRRWMNYRCWMNCRRCDYRLELKCLKCHHHRRPAALIRHIDMLALGEPKLSCQARRSIRQFPIRMRLL